MIQLGYMSNAEARYNLYSYSYTSSNSKTARDHWTGYADSIKKKCNTKGLVVEIGSNDAYLIKQFNDTDTRTLGVDSSKTMCDLAVEVGVDAYQALFNSQVSGDIRAEYGPAQVVIANNVFNHSNDPVDFAQGVASLLDHNGVFVFELPYWTQMVESGRFTDMVYHEHVSYFTIKAAWNLLKTAGLELTDFDIVDYHGGSIRGYARCASGAVMSDKIRDAINYEEKIGIFDPVMYHALQRKFVQERDMWLENFCRIRAEDPNAVIIGVGAAAKANTWLTWHRIDASMLHCITDASVHKQGKYTPLTRIPIVGDDEFAQHPNPHALILSWNISEGLKQALLNINPNVRFISQ
jgi:SAM-dependent methyltransferase